MDIKNMAGTHFFGHFFFKLDLWRLGHKIELEA